MKEKKIFLSVMKTYLVLVMILLIVLIGCSFYSYQSFKSNTKNAQVALLNQVQHEMDIRLENISKISQLLADHPIVQEIAELEDEQPEYQLKYTELNQFCAMKIRCSKVKQKRYCILKTATLCLLETIGTRTKIWMHF